jgi:hypothetical protein
MAHPMVDPINSPQNHHLRDATSRVDRTVMSVCMLDSHNVEVRRRPFRGRNRMAISRESHVHWCVIGELVEFHSESSWRVLLAKVCRRAPQRQGPAVRSNYSTGARTSALRHKAALPLDRWWRRVTNSSQASGQPRKQIRGHSTTRRVRRRSVTPELHRSPPGSAAAWFHCWTDVPGGREHT